MVVSAKPREMIREITLKWRILKLRTMKFRLGFAFGMIVIMILGSVPTVFSMAVPTVEENCIRAPYKTRDNSHVFYIVYDYDAQKCTKRAIKNSAVYFSHFSSWNEIHVVEAEFLNQVSDHTISFLPWGPQRKFRHGTLVKTPEDKTVYLLLLYRLYPIDSAEIFTKLGLQWNWIEDVTSDVIEKYSKGQTIDSVEKLPQGFAFKYPDSPDVYYIDRGPDGTKVKVWVNSVERLELIWRADRIPVFPNDIQFPNVVMDDFPPAP